MKKGLSILLCLILLSSVFSVLPLSAGAVDTDIKEVGTSKTAAEAVAWVKAQTGYTIGSGQCVALVSSYYSYLGVSPVSGNANDYTWNALPNGWIRTSSPTAGDIVVWGAGSSLGKSGYYADGTYGHIGIVTAVSGGYMDYYDQNAYPQGQVVGGHSGHLVSSAATFIHPNFAGSYVDNVAPTISNPRAENVTGSSFTIKCDLYDNVGVTRIWMIVYGPHGETGYGISASNGSFSHTINTSDYAGPGEYAVGFYAFDAANNATSAVVNNIYAYNDTTAPTISNARAENVTGSSFTIKCDLSDNIGVTRIWMIVYGPHGETGYGISASNGSFSHTINTSDYAGPGEYAVGFYAFDGADNAANCVVKPIYAFNVKTANYKNHNYELCEGNITWKRAKEICEQKGGHLAVINSAGENEALTNLASSLSNYVWIGGSDEGSEGNWYWVNGDDFSYTNWYSGEPSNSNGTEHYASLLGSSGKWNDAANDNAYISGFICEYEPEEEIILGDADGDGDVSVIDVTVIQRKISDIPVASFNENAADVDGDEELTIIDATFIQRYCAEINTPYPIGDPIS